MDSIIGSAEEDQEAQKEKDQEMHIRAGGDGEEMYDLTTESLTATKPPPVAKTAQKQDAAGSKAAVAAAPKPKPLTPVERAKQKAEESRKAAVKALANFSPDERAKVASEFGLSVDQLKSMQDSMATGKKVNVLPQAAADAVKWAKKDAAKATAIANKYLTTTTPPAPVQPQKEPGMDDDDASE